jgi:hypothetical protein
MGAPAAGLRCMGSCSRKKAASGRCPLVHGVLLTENGRHPPRPALRLPAAGTRHGSRCKGSWRMALLRAARDRAFDAGLMVDRGRTDRDGTPHPCASVVPPMLVRFPPTTTNPRCCHRSYTPTPWEFGADCGSPRHSRPLGQSPSRNGYTYEQRRPDCQRDTADGSLGRQPDKHGSTNFLAAPLRGRGGSTENWNQMHTDGAGATVAARLPLEAQVRGVHACHQRCPRSRHAGRTSGHRVSPLPVPRRLTGKVRAAGCRRHAPYVCRNETQHCAATFDPERAFR